MNIRDDQWEKLEPLLLGKKGDGGSCARNNRLFIEAVLWHISSRCNWGELPSKFGKWNTSYMRFKRWNEAGVWHQLAMDLCDAPELHEMIKKIAVYGDQQFLRRRLRASRKDAREFYSESIRKIEGRRNSGLNEDKSTLVGCEF
ncbi:transposase [Collimonas sp. PA-H2]|uniref:transposase n=1 Tax=Collimonas sp. PA-H2 TaxID=1881062 RepID=UPI000BF9E08C|nr:transposase [Collimonas sp. PA-H2]